jgi:hypothetical protein
MQGDKPRSGWDHVQGLYAGLLFCGLMWVAFSYLLPLVLSGQGWVPPGTGALGGLALMGVGAAGLAVVLLLRPKGGPPR